MNKPVVYTRVVYFLNCMKSNTRAAKLLIEQIDFTNRTKAPLEDAPDTTMYMTTACNRSDYMRA